MEKKFKNSFAVTGSEIEIILFKKEVELLGWNLNTNGGRGDCILSFSGYSDYDNNKHSLNPGYYWHPDGVTNEISLSTKSGWNEAIRLASEVVEEERYFKLIYDIGWYSLIKDVIYKASHRFGKNNITVGYASDKSKPDHSSDWQEVTKEDYDKQELLEEAKRRGFVDGVEFIDNDGDIYEVIGDIVFWNSTAPDAYKIALTSTKGLSLVYTDVHGWAQIITKKSKEEPKYTHKEWIDKITKLEL